MSEKEHNLKWQVVCPDKLNHEKQKGPHFKLNFLLFPPAAIFVQSVSIFIVVCFFANLSFGNFAIKANYGDPLFSIAVFKKQMFSRKKLMLKYPTEHPSVCNMGTMTFVSAMLSSTSYAGDTEREKEMNKR